MSVYNPNFLVTLRKRPDVFGKFVQNILFFVQIFENYWLYFDCGKSCTFIFLSYIFSMLFVLECLYIIDDYRQKP